jgi:hypothetical protein
MGSLSWPLTGDSTIASIMINRIIQHAGASGLEGISGRPTPAHRNHTMVTISIGKFSVR